jgi:hypothetical protein
VFDVADALNPNGCWPINYERRLRKALRAAQHGISYAVDAEASTQCVGMCGV